MIPNVPEWSVWAVRIETCCDLKMVARNIRFVVALIVSETKYNPANPKNKRRNPEMRPKKRKKADLRLKFQSARFILVRILF